MFPRLLLGVALAASLSPTLANAHAPNALVRPAVIAQASPSPAESTAGTATASPSPGAEDDEGGITGAGLVIAAILIGGLLLMRTRLLRR